MTQPPQCERVLGVLRDGRWHTIGEIHERAGTMRLNSRVAELRTRGHGIVCERRGGEYVYRLVGGPLVEGEGCAGVSAPHGARPSGEIPGSLAPSASGRSFSEEEAGRGGAFLGSPSVRPPGRGKESVSFSLNDESGQLAWDVAA